jgi:hypothetical protein
MPKRPCHFNARPEEAETAIGGFEVLNAFGARDVQREESGFGPQKAARTLGSRVEVVSESSMSGAQIVGGRAVDHHAASASQTGRFETEVLTTPGNLAALADLPGRWIVFSVVLVAVQCSIYLGSEFRILIHVCRCVGDGRAARSGPQGRARRRAPRIARARRDRHRYCGAGRVNGRRAAGAFSTVLIGDAASRMLLGGPVWSSPAHDLQLGGPGAKPTECKKYFPSVGETLRWVSSRRLSYLRAWRA